MLKNRKENENKDEMVNLNELIKVEMNFLNANMFFKYQVDLHLDLDESLPQVSGVYSHFSQAFMNIVQNALDAMYETTEKKLDIRTRHDEQAVFIDIVDTGCGIPESVRDKVFNLFFTTKPAAMERKGNEPFGTGLGLSSAHYFIRQYGGDIGIQSEAGQGTTVTVRIPHIQKKKELSRTRILVVDDSNTVLDVVVKICQDMGMEVFSATNGKKGLTLYNKWKPQIVISDLCMPELSGTEMMSQIRKSNPNPRSG
jgi:CheY-like chemotaxis protein